MKRALLIVGGTVGGLGAVLAITPPQLDSHGAMGGLSTIASASAASTTPIAQTTTTTPVATTPVATTPVATTPVATTPKATTVKKKKATRKKIATKKKIAVAKVTSKTTTPTATASTPAATTPTPTPVKSTPPAPVPTPVTKKVSGTFTGNVVNVNYGNVQVQITVVNGKITDAQALQAPSGRSDRYTQYALPILRSQTLAAQGSNIQGASGASYTSYGWYTSLQAALAKSGL
jgi:uncharacterized protein with FMN-binding domain